MPAHTHIHSPLKPLMDKPKTKMPEHPTEQTKLVAQTQCGCSTYYLLVAT